MAAKKKSAAKSAPKKKKAAAKKAASPKKAATAKKSAKAPVSSMDVNHGHVFALRPRVNTSFRPNDFMTAKRALREESFDSVSDAARAVAEEALALTRGESNRIDGAPRR